MSVVFRHGFVSINGSVKSGKKWHGLELRDVKGRLCHRGLPDSGQKFQQMRYVNNKMVGLLQWYEDFVGLKEVTSAQNRVVEAGEKLASLQEERRKASSALTDIQHKLKDIYAELDNTKRGDDRYVYLITEEHKLLKEEEVRQDKFKDAERAEREQFNILTNAVKSSHEKERTQAEKTKYWSIIGSVIGTIIGIIGTSINNYFRMSELKVIHESSTRDLKEELSRYMQGDTSKNISNQGSGCGKSNKHIEELLSKVDSRLEGCMKKIENLNSVRDMKLIPDSNEAELLVLHLESIGKEIQKENREIKVLIIGASLFCILVPFISKALFL